MLDKSKTRKNVELSILQIGISSLVLFILYRYLLDTLGAIQLGLWSLILATTSVSRFGELGLTGSALKFVAQYLARHEPEQASGVIQTTFLSIAVGIGVMSLLAYPLIYWIFIQSVPLLALEQAHSLLPWALLSFWLNAIIGVAISGLEGCQRFDLRAYLQISAHLFSLLLTVWLVPTYGLHGVAYAQLLQAIFILIVSWLLLKALLKEIPFIPWRWSRHLFWEMFGYGLHFQIISLTQLIYDPVTKVLLSKFGGLELTGYYELASRLVQHTRAILVNANRVLIPVFANLQETSPQQINKLYQDSYNLVYYFSILVYGALLAYSPVISVVWLGYYENAFVIFLTLLTLGWAVNNLSAPAYFAYLGMGQLQWNTGGHSLIAVLNLLLGILLGLFWGGVGVVVGWVMALILGSSFIVWVYHSKNALPLSTLVPLESRSLTVATGIGVFASLIIYNLLYNLNFHTSSLLSNVVIYLFVISYPFWHHSLRKDILNWK